jgi:hypothetical protein
VIASICVDTAHTNHWANEAGRTDDPLLCPSQKFICPMPPGMSGADSLRGGSFRPAGAICLLIR